MRITITSLTFVSAILVACAAPVSDPAASAKDGLSTVDGFCSARAEALCTATALEKCGGKDTQSCVAHGKADCLASAPQGTRYVPDKARACIDAVRAAYADGTLTADEVHGIDATCALVFSGPGAARAPCSVDADCSSADGLVCLIKLGETSGKCLAPHLIDQGGPCANEADVCAPDFYCDAMKKQCTPKGGEMESCNPQIHPCLPNLKCNGALFSTWCGPKSALGTPCTKDDECGSALCSKGRSSSEGTCAQAIILSPLSAACAPLQ